MTCVAWISNLFAQSENKIVIGNIDSLYSNILGEQRKIWIYIPEKDNNSSLKKYQVLYLLDGGVNFHFVTGIIKQLSRLDNPICPDMIIVGILSTDRLRDFTPTHQWDSTNTSGGGEKFTSFLEEELIPYVNDHYPAGPDRTLVGHSLGGLIVVNTLINHQSLFNQYVAIDPTLGWENQKFLKKAIIKLNQEKFVNRSLYISIANTMPFGMDTIKVANDTTRSTIHIRSIIQFCKTADSNDLNGLNFSWKYYPNENHASVAIISFYDALHSIFSWMKFNDWDKFYNSGSNYTGEEIVNLLNSYYQDISDKIGYTLLPSENEINNFSYLFMDRKEYNKSYALFNLNIQNYPNSAAAYNSMGDYYISQSDTTKAIEFMTKSMELGGLPMWKVKLDKLKAEKR
jgi:predicted alpha/beta superfamily hydrolase